MKAHVICNNDSVEFVFIGSEEDAYTKIESLADAHYEIVKYQNSGIMEIRDHKEYRARYFWHLHTVEYDDIYANQTKTFLAELYQVCGPLVDANILDNISAASRGLALPHETLLPYNHTKEQENDLDAGFFKRYQD